MIPGAEENELETTADGLTAPTGGMGELAFRGFLGQVPAGAVKPDTLTARQLPAVHKVELGKETVDAADQPITEYNAGVMKRWEQLEAQFANSPLNITDNAEFKKLVISGLIERNAPFVLGIETDQSRIPGSSAMKTRLIADGADPILAGNHAVQAAVAAGLDLNKDD